MIKKILSLLIVFNMLSAVVSAESILKEDYDSFTHTKINDWITAYHLTTEENIKNNYKGGEGFQLVYGAAISDVNPDAMIISTDTSGVYWTDNGGELWHPMESGISPGVNSLAFYPGSDKICFGTAFDYYPASGIYKSIDGGKTWERKFSFSNSKAMAYGRIAFGPETGEVTEDGLKMRPIYTTSPSWASEYTESYKGNPKYSGVFRSDDLGETFYNVGLADCRVRDIWADLDSDIVVVATMEKGICVSYNGGSSWTEVTGDLTQEIKKTDENGKEYTEIAPVKEFRTITVNPANENNWAAATPKNIYMSFDAGKTWEKKEPVWGEKGYNNISAEGVIMRLRYTYPNKETGKNALILSISQCNRSTRISYDNGKTFESVYSHFDMVNETSTAWTAYYPGAVALTPTNPDLILTAWNAIVVSKDHGQSFKAKNSGISGAMIYDFEFDKDGKIKYVGMLDFGIAKRVDGYEGEFPPMELINKYPTMDGGAKSVTSVITDPNDENHIFGTTGSGWVYGHIGYLVDTHDGFKSFGIYSDMRQHFLDIKAAGKGTRSARELKYSKTNPNVIYAGWFVSEDNGKLWRETSLLVREVSPFDGDVAYGILDSELVISYDRARTWKKTGIKLSSVREIVADIHEPFVIYVPIHGKSYIYRIDLKTSQVELWTKENGFYAVLENGEKHYPTEGFQMRDFSQDPKNAKHMVVTGMDFYASKTYLFETYDGGKNWSQVKGLPGGCTISALEFHPTEPRIYIGSSQGAYIYYFENYKNKEVN